MREWLRGQAAGGYITYDPDPPLDTDGGRAWSATGSPPNRRWRSRIRPGWRCPVRSSWPRRASGTKRRSPRRSAPAPASAGTSTTEDVFTGCEQFFRPGYIANLVPSWIPALDGVEDKLHGRRHGRRHRLRARRVHHPARPGSTRTPGSPAPTTTTSRSRWPASAPPTPGVADRVSFEVASAATFSGTGYDLAATFDCLHDMGDPLAAARHVRQALKPDGTWLIVEPYAADDVAGNINPVGRIYYSFSTLLCVPNALSQPGGYALGAQAGEAAIRQVADRRRFHQVPPRRRDPVQHRLRGSTMSTYAQYLVSPEWLRDHLDDPDLLLIDCRFTGDRASSRQAYQDGHIPGAVHVYWLDELCAPDTRVTTLLPDPVRAAEGLGRLGVGPDTLVVGYADNADLYAARLWHVLRCNGHPRVRLLDGGIQGWRDAGGDLPTGEHTAAPAVFPLRTPLATVISTEELRDRLDDRIIAAHRHTIGAEYAGTEIRAARGGHIPGAMSLPWDELTGTGGRFLPAPPSGTGAPAPASTRHARPSPTARAESAPPTPRSRLSWPASTGSGLRRLLGGLGKRPRPAHRRINRPRRMSSPTTIRRPTITTPHRTPLRPPRVPHRPAGGDGEDPRALALKHRR